MRVISIGTDRNLFLPESEVRERLTKQAASYDFWTILVFAKKSLGFEPFILAPNALVIPTNSRSRWYYVFDAVKLGQKLPQPDLVSAQDPFECGWAGEKLANFFQTKLELQLHTDFLNPYFAKQSVINRLRLQIARRLLPRADKIRVVSERIKKSLLATHWPLKAKIEVRPVSVNLDKIKTAPIVIDLHQKYPQFKKIILMASRLTWEKNIALAVQTMGRLVQKLPKLGLIIVGSGPEEAKLKKLVKRNHLEFQVIFEPWTDNLISYYKTADLFLNTSFYEGYGRTLVEAKACGLSIVSTDVGIAAESGATIVANEPESVAKAIITQLK